MKKKTIFIILGITLISLTAYYYPEELPYLIFGMVLGFILP
ncbi:hypothetical protein LCGC14_0388240 [marine sediment metagenome]|uniref:Uncharacterized protein n=1 Tax=marine sediment metagenome TaxID=412755 RepID=A0A0F9TIA0_9ZZZZ